MCADSCYRPTEASKAIEMLFSLEAWDLSEKRQEKRKLLIGQKSLNIGGTWALLHCGHMDKRILETGLDLGH